MAEDKPEEVEAGASRERAGRGKRKKAAQTTFTDPAVAKRNLYVLAVLVVVVVMPLLWQLPVVSDLVSQLGLRSYDLMLQANEFLRSDGPRRSPDGVAIVGVDETSLARYGRWPWDRSVMGELITGLSELGARTIALDVLYAEPQPSPLSGLEELRAALPPALQNEDLSARFRSIEELQRWLLELPQELQEDAVVRELQRRLVPPWEDELLRRAIERAGNVIMGVAMTRHAGSGASGVWIGDSRDPVPPVNLADFVRRHAPEYTEEDIQQLWEMEELHFTLFEAGAISAVRVGKIGHHEESLSDFGMEIRGAGNVTVDHERAVVAAEQTRAVGMQLPLPSLMSAARGAGFMNDTAVKDAVVRRFALVNFVGGRPVPSLSLAALAAYYEAEIELEATLNFELNAVRLARGKGDDRKIVARFECSAQGDVWVNYYGSRTRQVLRHLDGEEVMVERREPVLETIPAYRVLDAFRVAPDESQEERLRRQQEQDRLRRLVRGRVLFIGATALGLSDIRSTPLGEFRPGVVAHATIVANALGGKILRNHRIKEGLLLLGSTLWFLFVLAFLMPRMRPLVAFGFFVTLLGVAAAWCWVCFRTGRIIWPSEVIIPMLVFFGAGMAYLNLIENKEKAWLDGMFKRYVSPEYVEQIKANKGRLDLNGKEAMITPFFSDMAKFSTISEAFTAEGLFRFLGEYLGEMADILDEYGGTLDKFEGDAVVAFFGAPIPFEDHAAKACLASLHMHRRIRELEREWQTSDRYPELHQLAKKIGHWFPIRVRIGLNTGPCATGHLGTAERGNYTMMGDTVNLAARLEAAGKQYGISLTISEDTYQGARDVIVARPVDVIQVVGRTAGTPIYEVVGAIGEVGEAKEEFLRVHDQAWELYRGRSFAEARQLYQEALGLDPLDQVCKIFIERCREYEASPPPEDWDGVHVLTAK